jgi:NNP family nitrate/nitrite transporter-like MFS transporter
MTTAKPTIDTRPTAPSGADIADWRPEDETFWETTGRKIAYRNLWISIPALLCGFAVWGMWGVITVQMMNLGFPFSQAELFTLTAIAGISGATMRIPASFLIRLAGGRNTIFLTTAMLLAPAIGTGIVLQHPDWPLWSFQLMALWSGVGGGNFASSMSNISTFFPKRLQGTGLGLNAGLGNFGVTTMQIVIPLVMALGLLPLGYAAVYHSFAWLGVGVIVLLFGMYAWAIEPATEPEPDGAPHESSPEPAH